MPSLVKHKLAMKPLSHFDNARRANHVNLFSVFWRRDPETPVAVIARRNWIGRDGPWAVETPGGLPLLDNRRFPCRQKAFRVLLAEGGGWVNAFLRAGEMMAKIDQPAETAFLRAGEMMEQHNGA